MATYTDGIYLVSDSEDELHAFANGIGLCFYKFKAGKHYHYELIGNMVNKALLAGAQYKDTRYLVSLRLNQIVRDSKVKMLI